MVAKLILAASLVLVLPACAQTDQTAQPAQPVQTVAIANTPYTRDTPVEKMAADPAAAAVLNKDLPGLLTDSSYPFFKAMSLHSLQQASGGDLSAEDVDKTVADLQALPPR